MKGTHRSKLAFENGAIKWIAPWALVGIYAVCLHSPKHVQHGGVALLLEFRRIGPPALLPLAGPGPDAIATYCLPLTSKVMGGAEKPEPILIFHNSSSEVSSKAATVPSIRPRKTSPPPVDSAPEKFGYRRWMFFLISWVTGSTAVRLLSMRSTGRVAAIPAALGIVLRPIDLDIKAAGQGWNVDELGPGAVRDLANNWCRPGWTGRPS